MLRIPATIKNTNNHMELYASIPQWTINYCKQLLFILCLHLANANRSCFISNKAIKLVLHSKWDKLRVNHILFWAFIWLWLQVDCMVNGRKKHIQLMLVPHFFHTRSMNNSVQCIHAQLNYYYFIGALSKPKSHCCAFDFIHCQNLQICLCI